MDHNATDALVFASRVQGAHPLVREAGLAVLCQEAEHGGSLSRMAERLTQSFLKEVWFAVDTNGQHYMTVVPNGYVLAPLSWSVAVNKSRWATASERLRIAQVLVGL